MPTQQVEAAVKTSELSTTNMAKSFAAYKWLRSCMARGNYQASAGGSGYITQTDANSYDWFFGKSWTGIDANVSTSGVINEPNDGDTSCGEDEGDTLIQTAAGLWGYASGAALLCDIGFTRDVGSDCANVSSTGTNNFTAPSNGAAALDNWWTTTMGGSGTGISSIATGGEYSLYLQSFLAKCGTPSPSGEYTIQTFVAGSATPVATRYTPIDRDYTATNGSVRVYQDTSMTCGQLADRLKDPTSPAVLGYIRYLAANEGVDDGAATEDCPPGSTDPKCVTAAGGATSCSVKGLGWIVCPVVSLMATITDALYGYIQNFLIVQPLNVNTGDSSNTTYIAWSVMRNIANVAFVIAFLIIIFSQLTSVGVSNYGVKKMLPRLVIAAILVNLSYWVAAIAVDISNVIGNNIYSVLRNLPLGTITIETNVWENVLAWLLAGGAIGGLVVGGIAIFAAGAPAISAFVVVGLWAAVVFVLGALLALIVAFCIMAARQALIIILIVLSPLAFVAFLLPNTEKFFTTWRKALMTLLIFYPLFSVLFGGSYIAGMIIIGSAGQADGGAAVGMLVLLGMAVMVIPLALTPLLIRFSTGVMGTVAGMVNNKSKGMVDRARKVRDRKAGLATSETLNNPRNAKNPFSRVYRRIQNSSTGDAQRKKIIDSTNQAAYLGTDKAEQRSIQEGNAGQLVHTLEAEHKAEFEQQKSTDLSIRAGNADQVSRTVDAEHKAEFEQQKDGLLSLRENVAGIKVEARQKHDKASFEELKSTATPLAGNPNAAAIQEARDAQRQLDIDNSRVKFAGSVDQQELARDLQADPLLAAQMGGIAGARGAAAVTSSAQFTLQKAVLEEVDAERSQVAAIPNVAALNAAYATATSPARRAAIAERIITVGEPADYETIVNTAGANVSTDADDVVFRQTIGKALAANGPQSLKASDIDAITSGTLATRTGAANSFHETIKQNVAAGVYSQEKMVAETASNLRYAYDVADPAGRTELQTTSVKLTGNDTLNGKIKHNKTAIANLVTGTRP